jgi:signal peptidase II
VNRNSQASVRFILARWGWVPLVMGLILLADQTSKAWIERTISLGGGFAPIPALDPFFMLVYWGNTGTAFGLLQGQGGVLASVALVVIVVVLLFSKQLPVENPGVRLCVGMILAGAIGNQIDRARVGHVTDFLLFQLPVGDRIYQFPAFNVADSCITVGVILLAFLILRFEAQEAKVAAG